MPIQEEQTVEPQTLTLQIPFTCESEQHEKTSFQKDGHFISGLKDENGRRRDWEGNEVHIVSLKFKGEQVLRVMSDSLEDAQRLMVIAIQDTFFANFAAQFVMGFNYQKWTQLNDRRNQFQEFINTHYKGEVERGEHLSDMDVFDTAVRYMRKERKLSSAPDPEKASDWMPKEWRG